MRKAAFPPRLKAIKQQKMRFRRGGRTKNGKCRVSAVDETLKYDISKRKVHLKYIVFIRVLKNISYLCRTRTITTFR
ncbi:MAG: hypothetical protein ACTTJ9_06975 [Segatella oris]|uniref:hypothetical protein n=1 Tax=Segatella oris TaxID=28135 RepID=UPI003FA28217